MDITDFSWALRHVKTGSKIARKGWNGSGMYVYLATTELPYPPLRDMEWKAGTFNKSSFLVMKTANDELIPWLASQTDILAEDWEILQ